MSRASLQKLTVIKLNFKLQRRKKCCQTLPKSRRAASAQFCIWWEHKIFPKTSTGRNWWPHSLMLSLHGQLVVQKLYTGRPSFFRPNDLWSNTRSWLFLLIYWRFLFGCLGTKSRFVLLWKFSEEWYPRFLLFSGMPLNVLISNSLNKFVKWWIEDLLFWGVWQVSSFIPAVL